jgi:hypothetical protein
VSDDANPRDADIEEVNARLSDGLKACRSMVANYKALLKSDEDIGDIPDEDIGDAPDDGESDEPDPAASEPA